jgi:large subunit ribosomal protein L19
MGLMDKVEAAHVRSDRPEIRPGDTVEVSVRVVEGDKTRQQKFRGEVINVRGSGTRKTFTVRKTSEGIGVERTFPLQSPSIGSIEVIKSAKVRRAKLFYLRSRSGKAARLSEKKTITPTPATKSSKKAAKAKPAVDQVADATDATDATEETAAT